MVPHRQIQILFSKEERTDAGGGGPKQGSIAAAQLCRAGPARGTGAVWKAALVYRTTVSGDTPAPSSSLSAASPWRQSCQMMQKGPVSGTQGTDFSFQLSSHSGFSRLPSMSTRSSLWASACAISSSWNVLLTISTCCNPASLQRGPQLTEMGWMWACLPDLPASPRRAGGMCRFPASSSPQLGG